MEKLVERVPLLKCQIFHVGWIAKWAERKPTNWIGGHAAAIGVSHDLTVMPIAEATQQIIISAACVNSISLRHDLT